MSEVTVTSRHVRAVVTMRRIRLADRDVSRVRAGHAARATERRRNAASKGYRGALTCDEVARRNASDL